MKRLKLLSLKYFHVIRKEIKVIEFSWDLILRIPGVGYTQKGKVYIFSPLKHIIIKRIPTKVYGGRGY